MQHIFISLELSSMADRKRQKYELKTLLTSRIRELLRIQELPRILLQIRTSQTRELELTANAPNEVNTTSKLTYAKRNLKSEKVTEKLITYVMRRSKA